MHAGPDIITKPYDRFGTSRRKAGDPRSDVSVDRDRIIHCHAFRRLQRKTQIVGMSGHGFIRSRLTHTIECAQIGRAISNRLTDDAWQGVVEHPSHLADLVEAACLTHDLGHPPFGHTGEEALDRALRDLADIRFEGNAQSFRIVTLLEPKKYTRERVPTARPLGLDLTRATLMGMSKYPWSESDPRAADAEGKFGVYDDPDDREYFAWLWPGGIDTAHRTLVSDILEAADDIAYAVHDIEDGIWAGLIPIAQLAEGREWTSGALIGRVTRLAPGLFSGDAEIRTVIHELFSPLSAERWATRPFDRSRRAEAGLKSFCSGLTGRLIASASEDGSLRWLDNDWLQQRIAVLKSVVWTWMIEQPDLVARRFGQRRIIRDLMDWYLAEPGMLPYQSDWHVAQEQGDKAAVRFVADHVASMTDAQAQDVHNEMRGVDRP